MTSLEQAWQMPGMDMAYQFFEPPAAPRRGSTALVPSSKQSMGRRSVGGLSSTGSDETPRDTRRNFHRKVRTGCATCKVRHVKCDEAKPACRRCSSTGRKCDGYPALKNQRQNAPLLPRSGSSKEPVSIAPSARSQSGSEGDTSSGSGGGSSRVALVARKPAPSRGIGFFEPDEPLEQRYLEMFHIDTLPQIWRLEISRPAAWRKLVMQLVQREPAVRQSAIALAAAHERQKLVASGTRDDPNKLALAYYNKAIQHIITDAKGGAAGGRANSTHDPVVLLTMCLLFVAIEMFLNRDGPTRTHIQCGAKILREARFADHADDERDMIGTSFAALDSHAATYPGWGASQYEGGLVGVDTRPLAPWPAYGPARPRLADLGEAIRGYYSVVTESTHQLRAFASDPAADPAAYLPARDRMLADLGLWREAFAELQARGGGAAIRPDQAFLAELLTLGVETRALVLRGAFDASQTQYDALVPQVAALALRLHASLLTRDPESSNFSVDTLSNEVPLLWQLFCLCRHPAVRRELRDLVWLARARRGVWCTMTTHLVMGHVLQLEEAGLVSPQAAADIPAAQRLVDVCIDVSGARRDVRVRYRYACDRGRPLDAVLRHARGANSPKALPPT